MPPSGSALPWLRVGTVGAVAGTLAWLDLVWSADCDELECISTGLLGLAVGVILLPVVAVLGLVLLRVPRPVRTGLLGCVASVSVGSAAVALDAALRSTGPGVVASWPAVVVAGVLSGGAGLVLASDRFATSQRWATGLALALVLALTGAATS